MTVGLVVVSHSADIAAGVRDLAAQMAPAVRIRPAGGGDDGGIGTSFDRIGTALDEADDGDGVIAVYDLGSALLTTEMALEMADPELAGRRRIVDAPLVEGAIAAAVEAEGGGDLDAVERAARSAGAPRADDAESEHVESEHGGAEQAEPDSERDVEIVNPLGLHARPAATLARLVNELGTRVSVSVRGGRPVDLRSVMSVVSLATRKGDVVRLAAEGTSAAQALDRVAATIGEGFGELDPGRSGQPPADRAGTAPGPAPGAPGIAVGPLARLSDFPRELSTDSDVSDADSERERLATAIDAAATELERGDEFAQAHAAIVRDPALWQAATGRCGDDGAARTWWNAVLAEADRLAAAGDEVVAARAVDVRDAGGVVLRHLGVEVSRVERSVRSAVVLVDELGPAEVPELVENGCAAVVLRRGSPTAHAVVVARGLGLPVVLRVGGSIDTVADGTTVVVDGSAGSIDPNPTQETIEKVLERMRADRETAEQLRAAATESVSYSGSPVLVAANVGSLADARAAVAHGADGVGLLRTELLVLDRDDYPDEDQQTADLGAILDVLGDRPAVIRVLDAGGDKPVRSLDIGPEHHGFLGVRGLRYLLEHPELLRTQLRAICRAAIGHRVSVMAPMVTVPDEARAFRRHVEDAVQSLRSDGVQHEPPEAVGVMVEVPAAALAVRDFAEIVDFLSVGSNDLLSYLTAADRTEDGVAHLLDTDSPAFGRVLDLLGADAQAADLPLAVCGELAADPQHTDALLRRGVRELSMAPARIPLIKKTIRDL